MASHPEVLVGPVIKEKSAFGRMVCIEYIHPKPLEGEICGGPFWSIPEADRLPNSMYSFYSGRNGFHFRLNHPTLAVPLLGELAEVGADHRDLL